MKIIVNRLSDTGKETISNISVLDGGKILFTCVGLELPWKDNASRVSCIPDNEYDCEKVGASASIPYPHIAIKNVPNRAGICIHKANFISQLLGCLAVGDKHVDINKDGNLDVTNSGKTFDKLMAILPNQFKIEIR